MPIQVRCDCGHEITVSDSMAGRRGRCPECDGVIRIPGRGRRPPRGGAFVPPPLERRGEAYGSLAAFGGVLSLFALLVLFALVATGIYAGVTALREPANFTGGPFGLFSEYRDEVRENPTALAIAFMVGGIVAGALGFLVLAAASQTLRLFASIEKSLAEIAAHLGRGPD